MKASNEISSRRDSPAEHRRSAASSSSTAERFELRGPSIVLDNRVHAYRRDIADIALAGELFAPHYARPVIKSCGMRPAYVYPSTDARPISTELLPGEQFAVLEISGGWAWGYCRHDHYVGYIEVIELVDHAPSATHIVAALDAPILPEPDVNVPSLASLPMGARVAGHEQDGFLATDIGYLAFTQLRRIDAYEHDPVAVAERLIGRPYLLGGRSPRGIDCSGLVQIAHSFCGIATPRDSDQQRALGEMLAEDVALQRGDIILFEGHVGMMADGTTLLHATGRSGDVRLEPLAEVAERNPVLQRRRLKR